MKKRWMSVMFATLVLAGCGSDAAEKSEKKESKAGQELTKKQSTSTENKQENQKGIQKIDLSKSSVNIDGEDIPVIDQSVMEGKITLRTPKLFSIMPPELVSIKYPSEQRPTIIYTDESTTVNLAFNMTTNALSDKEIEEFQEDMIDMLKQAQPSAEWLDTDVVEINDKKIGFLEVITPALDGDIYNLMFITSIDGQALIGTFNCMEKDSETWRPVARAMLETLQFNAN